MTDEKTAPAEKPEQSTAADAEILRVALERFAASAEATKEIREKALEDLKFRAGEQWDANIRNARDIDNRPSLTINRIPQFVRQVTNDQRQNRPSIKVSPVDDKADVETAKTYQGLIKHIEYNSNAAVAYDTAFEGAVTGGFGWMRVVTDYCDPLKFEQEILIKRIRNPFKVYGDPGSTEPDGSDSNWGFVIDDLRPEEFKALHANAKLSTTSSDEMKSVGDGQPLWVSGQHIRVAEYFTKTFERVELCKLSDDRIIKKADAAQLPKGVEIVAEKTAVLPRIKWYKITANEILERADWAGSFIPLIPVIGDELEVDGKLQLEGIIRHAKDPQRQYNYWASAETEMITLAPRAPYIGAVGQFKTNPAQWEQANRKNIAYLEYDPVDLNGNLAPPPTRNVFEPPVQAITMARMQSADDLKATTGMYDAALGNRSNEQSGIAIQRRTLQAQTSNFHFVDNLSRSIRHVGRICVELIPYIYDTPRAVRILGEEGQEEVVQINQDIGDGKFKNHLGAGKYDVAVEVGPSFATRRQEALASMIDFTKALPQAAGAIVDLIAKNMDWPGSKEMADRLKKTLPPGMAESDDKDKKPIPPEVQAQMQQAQQIIDQLTSQLNSATEQLNTKKIEMESKERIEYAKLDTQLAIEAAKLDQKDSHAILNAQMSEIQARQNLLNSDQPITGNKNGAGPEPAMAPQEQEQPTGGLSPGNSMGENHEY